MYIEKKDINRISVRENTPIIECVNIINRENSQMLLIINNSGALIGVVSDGDIRRKFVVKEMDPFIPINRIMNTNPIVVNVGETKKAEKYILEKQISFVPIVDDYMVPQGVFTWREIVDTSHEDVKILDAPIVIMAGGRGERLKPYTNILPKPLLPIGDKTMIERIMDSFGNYGANRFYISLNYKKDLIKSYFNSILLPYSIQYIEEDEYLGTCGALSIIENLNETFILSNCDTLFEIDFGELIEKHRFENNALTVVVCDKQEALPYGIFELDDKGKVCKFTEKPKKSLLINTGLYVMEPTVINYIQKGKSCDMNELIMKCIKMNEKIGLFLIQDGSWKDMGQLGEVYRRLGEMNI